MEILIQLIKLIGIVILSLYALVMVVLGIVAYHFGGFEGLSFYLVAVIIFMIVKFARAA